MRVLWITERHPPDRGGAAVSSGRQVRALVDRGFDVDVLRLDAERPAGRVEAATVDGATVHRVGRGRENDESLSMLHAVATGLVAERRPDVVHGFYAVPAGWVAAVVGRELGIPTIVSLRGNDIDRGTWSPSRLPFLRGAIERADLVASVSREAIVRARALTGRERGFAFLPNGVDTRLFRPNRRSDRVPPVPPALEQAPRPWIAFNGELRWKKGLPVLQRLAEQMVRESFGTLLFFGGVRKEEREGFESWKRNEPTAASRVVEFPWEGNPDRLAPLLRLADLFVFPSIQDGMPNGLLEAMASRRPAIACAVGGIPDVIVDGRCGGLVPPHRLDRFPEEALRISRLPAAELDAAGAAARDRIERDFSLEAEADALVAIHQRLTSGSPR